MNGPTEMCAEIKNFNYVFPYCFDGDVQKASRDIGFAVTPDFFVYDKELSLVYRGSFDATRPAGISLHSICRGHIYIYIYFCLSYLFHVP